MSDIADWTAIENAAQTQIAAASGLAPTQVIWGLQSRDRPAEDFVSIEIGTVTSITPLPEQTTEDNPGGAAGEEIVIRSREHIEFPIRVTMFAIAPTGRLSARAQLSALLRRLGSESFTDALAASGLALVDSGSAIPTPAVFETEYRSRAYADLQFRTVDGVEEKTTYIETVNYTTSLISPGTVGGIASGVLNSPTGSGSGTVG